MLNVLNSRELLKSHTGHFIPDSSRKAIFSSSSKAVPYIHIQEIKLHLRSFSEILKKLSESQTDM